MTIPFLKWAGGKRWLVRTYPDLLPKHYENYLEPFLGSAAVFFHLNPKNAILADFNSELINTYIAIRQRPDLVQRYLITHSNNHSSEYYYKIRAARFRSPPARAAQLIYLNRTCWNALYRVNLKGKFNVPIGTKTSAILDTDNFEEIAAVLEGVQLICADFEETIDLANDNDFLFVDPPYTVRHNFNGFVKYNEKIFSWDDQIRLRDCVIRAVDRGAKVLVTNANHRDVQELYHGFELDQLTRSSVISGTNSARGEYSELVIRAGF